METIKTLIIIFLIILIICIVVVETPKIKFKGELLNALINQTFYWINLDKAVERRNNMIQLFNKHNIKNVRIDAILGGPTESKKAIACTSSHIKAIKTFLKSDDYVGIICEDDLTMEYKKYWRCDLDKVINNAPKDWDIIQLALIGNFFTFHMILSNAQNDYIHYHPWSSSTLCYIINRKGALKIIKNNNPPTNCAEDYIYRNVNTYTFKYPMFTYPTDNDSTIHPNHLSFHVSSKNKITNYLKYVVTK